ncbi:hypothetical protein SPI_05053 [Niveomyces insectorum RCEF 264]|uniref:2EXR domain-containing protein n=1 Tax=Niveomyces insectorum RCEF 264 TaxID=1081102 RepID=A0A167TWP7_9HYPO|nr:hypothetical protein SPI_05053 [Niveomyces insectorum RCEF 264]
MAVPSDLDWLSSTQVRGPAAYLSSGYSWRFQAQPRRRFWLEFSVLPNDDNNDNTAGCANHTNRTPRTFLCFGRLPAEIRLHVWEWALRQPRIVAITSRSAVLEPGARPPPPLLPKLPELPALMTVCREARALARTHYERAFAWHVPLVLTDDDDDDVGKGIALPPAATAGCWFNFAHDAVLLRGELEPCADAASTSMVYFLPRSDTVRVRHVACQAADLGVGTLFANQLYARLFPIVDRFAIRDRLLVVVVAHDGDGDVGRGLLGSYEARDNNVCQQVWDRWTNSQNMPLLTASGRTGRGRVDAPPTAAASETPSTAAARANTEHPGTSRNGSGSNTACMPSSSGCGTDTARSTFVNGMRIVMLPEDRLYQAVANPALYDE